MKTFNPDNLGAALRTQQKFAADIRLISTTLTAELKSLDSDKVKQKHTVGWIADEKRLLKNAAEVAALKIRKDAVAALEPVSKYAEALDIDLLLRTARFVEAPEPMTMSKEVPMLQMEKTFVSFVEKLGPAIAELGDQAARARASEEFAGVDAAAFVQIIKKAETEGDLATLAAAERAVRTRVFAQPAQKSRVLGALSGARSNVQIPGLEQSRGIVEQIRNANLNVLGTESAIRTGGEDTRATMERLTPDVFGLAPEEISQD